jgi:hypothetical protein
VPLTLTGPHCLERKLFLEEGCRGSRWKRGDSEPDGPLLSGWLMLRCLELLGAAL